MGAVSGMATTTGLAILESLPDGFLDCVARDLHLVLDGPTLIELAGKRGPPLFVSILQHGNEDSGLGAIQRVLKRYQNGPLPRSLMLLIGNVETVAEKLVAEIHATKPVHVCFSFKVGSTPHAA